jgi:reactive intermediate/imine deaminase
MPEQWLRLKGAIMPTQKIQPESLFQRMLAGHVLYNHVVAVEAQRLIFISGQLARDKTGEIVGPGDMRAQIKQVGENLNKALEAAGCTLADLVKITTFVTDIDEFFRHVDVRNHYFGIALPASTTIEVRRLAHPDLMVEIEAIAVRDS